MDIDPAKVTPLMLLISLCGLVPETAVAQHVHGVIELGIVVEGDTIAVSLDAPMSDVVGFEHKPESAEQVEKIEQAASLLANADAMFGLTESASCKVASTLIDGPDFVEQQLGEGGGRSHDDHHDHDEHEGEQHSEIVANYEWKCGDTSALDALELRFTNGFASVEKIKVQIITAAGAQVMTKEGRGASIPLSPQ